jgi:pimeloyl-ACP methyl ester carboxylesterase
LVAGNPRPGVRAVLVVGGFASGCCDEGPAVQGESSALYAEQFSYWGLTGEGDPLPHTGLVTDTDLARAAQLLAAQVEHLAVCSGGPVALVAESEGTLVVAAFLDRYPQAPVDRVMMLSPIIEPARVTYPGPGEEGRGVVAGYQLRALSMLIDSMAPFTLSADGALAESVRREAEDLQEALLGDHPGIEEVAVLPLADAVSAPGHGVFPIEVIVVPGFHGGLRGRADVQDMIRSWVLGGDLEGSALWLTVNRVIAGTASAWQVPGLDALAGGSG